MTLRIAALALAFVAAFAMPGIGAQTSAELQRALAAAERAGASEKGREYQHAFNRAVRDILIAGMRDCISVGPHGIRSPSSFKCVLIIDKRGKPKWIIRDSRDRVAQCFYGKLVTRTYPAPPADNWPVLFGIDLSQ